MIDHALAALFVLLLWWGSTGVILLLDGLPRSTYRFSVFGMSLLALGGLCGLVWSSRSTKASAAYLAFSCTLAIWAWHELTFLMGLVTGPRKEPCPHGATGWRRFRYATAAVLHHELALALTLALVVTLTWGAPNQVGTWSFVVLWTMRLSAKLNVFLGVRNLTIEFIPEHLRYLLSYFRRSGLNPLMPFSLLVASAVAVRLVNQSVTTEGATSATVGQMLVATLLGLAILEHLFLALPVPDALLWRWAMNLRRRYSSGSRSPIP